MKRFVLMTLVLAAIVLLAVPPLGWADSPCEAQRQECTTDCATNGGPFQPCAAVCWREYWACEKDWWGTP